MSKTSELNILVENNKLVHIVADVLMFAGLGVYMYSQNKQMNSKIEELTTKLQEKEEMCTKLESTIQQFTVVFGQINQRLQQHDNGLNILSERINSLNTTNQAGDTQTSGRKQVNEGFKKSSKVSKTAREIPIEIQAKEERPKEERPKEVRHVKPLLKETPPVARVSKIQFKKPIVEDDSDDDFLKSKGGDEELSDSDLDNEISKELAELEEDSSLKKDE